MLDLGQYIKTAYPVPPHVAETSPITYQYLGSFDADYDAYYISRTTGKVIKPEFDCYDLYLCTKVDKGSYSGNSLGIVIIVHKDGKFIYSPNYGYLDECSPSKLLAISNAFFLAYLRNLFQCPRGTTVRKLFGNKGLPKAELQQWVHIIKKMARDKAMGRVKSVVAQTPLLMAQSNFLLKVD